MVSGRVTGRVTGRLTGRVTSRVTCRATGRVTVRVTGRVTGVLFRLLGCIFDQTCTGSGSVAGLLGLKIPVEPSPLSSLGPGMLIL